MTNKVIGKLGVPTKTTAIRNSSNNPLYKFEKGKRVAVIEPRKCLVCPKVFKPKVSIGKYCSITCYWKMKKMRGDRVVLTPDARRRIAEAARRRNLGREGWCKGKKRPEITGDKHPLWKGGRYYTNNYIWLSNNGREIAEHRFVMEQHLKRKLLSKEIVHHINHDKTDNRIENLQLLTRSEHIKIHPPKKTKTPKSL